MKWPKWSGKRLRSISNAKVGKEQDMILLSILMSVYNAEATLAASLDSVLAQTYRDFELIICDDASTDASWEIISEYCARDHRIIAFQNNHNCGLGASLNCCFKRAKGIYIARQDADDISAPERLERTLQYLQKNSLPYVGCGVYVFDDTGIWSRRIFPERITKHTIAKKNPFFHPTMIFKREMFESAGGYRVTEVTRRTEDYDLVMRLAGMGIIGRNLQEFLYYVYEPPEAYLRHTPGTRLAEVRVRLFGLKQMKSPFWDYIFLIKPLLLLFVPRKALHFLKCVQWKNA